MESDVKLRGMAGTIDADNQFPDWLLEQLKAKGWTREELSRRADVPSSAITNIVNRTKNMGPDVARRIATALDVSPVVVFRIAGLLPDEGDNLSPTEAAIIDAYREQMGRFSCAPTHFELILDVDPSRVVARLNPKSLSSVRRIA